MPKIKTKVSITFLGTENHRDTHKSVLVTDYDRINALASQPDSPIAAWLIDGPGCIGSPEHPRPGTYFYTQGKKIRAPDQIAAASHKFQAWLKRTYGALTGEGVESSLLEAVVYLEEIIAQNAGVLPKEISLQGFSRGADNCVRLANTIYKLHPDIKINLFLVDPVPGPGRLDNPESYHIPPSVQDCQIALMLNEHKRGFEPQHPDRYVFTNPKTKVAFQYLPGRHGAGLVTRDNFDLTPAVSQTLLQDSLLKYHIEHELLPRDATNEYSHHLVKRGVYGPRKLASPQKPLSNKERFGHLCHAMDVYTELANRWEVALYYKRRIYTERERYVLDSKLFINQEHRELFKALFPATFNWFFEKNTMPIDRSKPYTKRDVLRECQTLKHEPYTAFYKNFLTQFHMPDIEKESDILDQPQGIARIEKASYHQPLVTNELSYLQFCLQSIVSHYHYRIPKPWLHFWSSTDEQQDSFQKNSQSDVFAKEIKEALFQSKRLPPYAAKSVLKRVIANIMHSSKGGFFPHEISKIIPDSNQYMRDVLATLQRYQPLLPASQSNWIAKTVYMIQKQIANPYKDAYQKRQHVQTYLVGLSTALRRINKETIDDEPVMYQQLLDSLNQLSRPSYAETRLQDKIITALESYISWCSFLAYFPLAQFFGLYNPDTISIANDLLGKLYELKSSSLGLDLFAIEAILKNTSLQYSKLYQRAEGDNIFTVWNKHLMYKRDPLNHIIESHLKKVIKLSNLVFSIPKGPDQDLDVASQYGLYG